MRAGLATTAARALAARRGEGRFDPAEVHDLPEPARRYLTHAFAPGASLPAVAHLAMRGELKLNGRWRPFRASQWLDPSGGFVWRASVRVGPMVIRGADTLWGGAGEMRWRLLGLIPVVDATGPDVTRSDRGRAAVETIWTPTALLPSRGAVWRPVDADTASATISVDGEAFDVAMTVDAVGRVRAVSTERWGQIDGKGPFRSARFGALADAERSVDGVTVPCRVRVGFHFGTPDFPAGEFLRADVSHVAFR
ncbi:MAG: hypothetical protein CVU56_25765 [Deltaproteobacteria bacterium HGW-Deltaproteobacteria-14]|jgi:hypothetical protein|nr:MAG: hypothetical protein CVU56_25765 [Deltaproteobacteria bacterium HGW-Deltaproteobacteria-14]